jgi:hypothetical protein
MRSHRHAQTKNHYVKFKFSIFFMVYYWQCFASGPARISIFMAFLDPAPVTMKLTKLKLRHYIYNWRILISDCTVLKCFYTSKECFSNYWGTLDTFLRRKKLKRCEREKET